MQSNIMTE